MVGAALKNDVKQGRRQWERCDAEKQAHCDDGMGTAALSVGNCLCSPRAGASALG